MTTPFLPRLPEFERAPSLSVLLAGAILATAVVAVIAGWLQWSTAPYSQLAMPAANEIMLELTGP